MPTFTATLGFQGPAGPPCAFGTHAARPAASAANNGQLYYETDTSSLFLSNGTSWIAQAGSGLTSVTTNATLTGAGTTGSPLGVVYGTGANTAAQGNDSRITSALSSVTATAPLSGAGTAGSPLVVAVGTANGTVAAGNDSRITGALQAPASPAQGDVIYYNGSAWVRLPAATAGQSLLTQGAGANPNFGYATTVGTTSTATIYQGGARVARTAVSAATYAQLATDYIIAYTGTTGCAITLLAAASTGGTATEPVVVVVKDEGGNAGTSNINVSVASAGTIDGSTTAVSISTNYLYNAFYCNGTAWFAL